MLIGLFVSCAPQKDATVQEYLLQGRYEKQNDGSVSLIGSASSVSFDFTGEHCSVSLKSTDTWEHQNYVALELDGEYIGRLKIEKGDTRPYIIPIKVPKSTHHLSVYKATESANGTVVFTGTTADVRKASYASQKSKKRIEFIGNSITSGMGNDTAEIPCGKGEWFDQHNAYWAYGPIVCRSLGVNFLLSSVSGIGMYRNWNDEHDQEAIMPDVYEKLYLKKDSQQPYDFAYKPDIISICLGTNDLSDGDGKKARLPFNEEKFTSNYIGFIKMLYLHNPKARIVLLTSPMVSGTRNITLLRCLNKVVAAFSIDPVHKPIEIFQYQPMTPHGCGSHPDIEDHKIMAKQLQPFFKKLLDEE
jgi:lysophospholipase L1-like esterase